MKSLLRKCKTIILPNFKFLISPIKREEVKLLKQQKDVNLYSFNNL